MCGYFGVDVGVDVGQFGVDCEDFGYMFLMVFLIDYLVFNSQVYERMNIEFQLLTYKYMKG